MTLGPRIAQRGRPRRTSVGVHRQWVRAAFATFAVAWGANQFVAMLIAYREERHYSTSVNDELFGLYAAALTVTLLLAGPAADLWGRRRVVRPSVVLSFVATVLLMAGQDTLGLLFAGRFLAGIASGGIFAAGSAWVKELSTGDDPKAGARRASIALSLGFGLGGLTTGVVAQWAPDRLVVAYLPHLALVVVAAVAVWRVPETVPSDSGARGYVTRLRVASAKHPRFLRVVLPAAPWVFGAPAISFAMLPSLVSGRTGHYAILFAGVATGLTLSIGAAVQPYVQPFDRPGRANIVVLALLASLVGCVVTVFAAQTLQPWLALLAAVRLGLGYGLGMVGGLLETQRIADSEDLAGLTAVFLSVTYFGFWLPLVLAKLNRFAGYPTMLSILAGLALITMLVVRFNDSRLAAD